MTVICWDLRGHTDSLVPRTHFLGEFWDMELVAREMLVWIVVSKENGLGVTHSCPVCSYSSQAVLRNNTSPGDAVFGAFQ